MGAGGEVDEAALLRELERLQHESVELKDKLRKTSAAAAQFLDSGKSEIELSDDISTRLLAIIAFHHQGFVKMPQILPELRQAKTLREVYRAFSQTMQQYADYTRGYMLDRFGVDCEAPSYVSVCDSSVGAGVDFESDADDLAVEDAAKAAFRSVVCCAETFARERNNGTVTLPECQGLNSHRFSAAIRNIAEARGPDTLGSTASMLLQAGEFGRLTHPGGAAALRKPRFGNGH